MAETATENARRRKRERKTTADGMGRGK